MAAKKPKKEPVSGEMSTPVGDRVEALRQLFPEAFAEGKLDLGKFREAVGDLADDRAERYSFIWAGKRDAIRLLQAPSRATLVPCPNESVDWDTTKTNQRGQASLTCPWGRVGLSDGHADARLIPN